MDRYVQILRRWLHAEFDWAKWAFMPLMGWKFFFKFFGSNPQMPTVYPHSNKKRPYNTHIGWRRMIRESAELYSVLSIITPHWNLNLKKCWWMLVSYVNIYFVTMDKTLISSHNLLIGLAKHNLQTASTLSSSLLPLSLSEWIPIQSGKGLLPHSLKCRMDLGR